NLKSPENYLGHERTENFASPGGATLDQRRVYAVPARLRLNQWALSCDWTVQKPAIVLNRANGRIAYRFHARDLHLVMGPAARGTSVRFRVLIDGQPPGAAHGSDVDEQGPRHGDRPAAVSTDPATQAHCRSSVRDRVSRCGCIPRNSRADMRTASSMAASGTICPKKLCRPLPRLASMSTGTSRRHPVVWRIRLRDRETSPSNDTSEMYQNKGELVWKTKPTQRHRPALLSVPSASTF